MESILLSIPKRLDSIQETSSLCWKSKPSKMPENSRKAFLHWEELWHHMNLKASEEVFPWVCLVYSGRSCNTAAYRSGLCMSVQPKQV